MKRDDWSRSAWCLYLFSISGHWQQRRRARPYRLESKWCVPWPQHTEDSLPAFQPSACHWLSLRTSTQHSALMYILSWLQVDPFLFSPPETTSTFSVTRVKETMTRFGGDHLKAFFLTVLWKSYLCVYVYPHIGLGLINKWRQDVLTIWRKSARMFPSCAVISFSSKTHVSLPEKVGKRCWCRLVSIYFLEASSCSCIWVIIK